MKPESLLRILSAVLAALGAFILVQSTMWAFQMQNRILQTLGSLSGDAAIAFSYEGPAAALRLLGGILLGVGLFRLLEKPAQG